jgi:hypothetical protein
MTLRATLPLLGLGKGREMVEFTVSPGLVADVRLQGAAEPIVGVVGAGEVGMAQPTEASNRS